MGTKICSQNAKGGDPGWDERLVFNKYTQVLFYIRLFYAFFALTPLTNLHRFLICAPSFFRFNALGLGAFHYANPLFIIEIFFIYGFSIYTHFFRNSAKSWNKGWVYTVKLWTGFSWPRMDKAWGRRACVNIATNLLKWWGVFCVAERSLVFQVSFSTSLDLLCPD